MPIFILDSFRSAFNVGSVFRSAEAVSPAAVFITGICCRPSNRKLRHSARGTQAEVPWRYFDNVLDAVKWARTTGRTIAAVENTVDAIPLWDAPFDVSSAFILGNEALGICSDAVVEADYRIYLPQTGNRNCINVSSTAAVIASEIQRRRFLHAP